MTWKMVVVMVIVYKTVMNILVMSGEKITMTKTDFVPLVIGMTKTNSTTTMMMTGVTLTVLGKQTHSRTVTILTIVLVKPVILITMTFVTSYVTGIIKN